MPRRAVTVVGLLVTGALAACGHGDGGAPAAGAVDPVRPAPDVSPVRPEPAKLIDAGQTDGLTSMPWRLLDITDTSLTIQYVIGDGCDSAAGLYLSESDTRVLLGAYSRTSHGAEACAALLKAGTAVIPLTQPLGTRHLVHVVVAPDQQRLL